MVRRRLCGLRTRYSQRKLTGEEFKRLNFSEAGTIAEHGLAVGTIKASCMPFASHTRREKQKKKQGKYREETQRQKEASGLAISDSDTAPPDSIIAYVGLELDRHWTGNTRDSCHESTRDEYTPCLDSKTRERLLWHRSQP